MGILYSVLPCFTASSHDTPASNISPNDISHPFPLLPRPRASPSASLAELPSARIRIRYDDASQHRIGGQYGVHLESAYTPAKCINSSESPLASFDSSGSSPNTSRNGSTRKLRKTRIVDEGWDLVRYGDWEGFETEQRNLARSSRLRQEPRFDREGGGEHQ